VKTIALLCWIPRAAGCAQLKANQTVCPEYRDLRCATAPECALDEARGCQLCRCAPPPAVFPPAVPPAREGEPVRQ
jgi:hypothetical protein